MLGSALNCEMCLGGMKAVQWLLNSSFFINSIIGVGNDFCYLVRNHFMYQSCSGYVAAAVPAVSESLAAFMFSPEYACEREWLSCVNHEWYTPLTTQ